MSLCLFVHLFVLYSRPHCWTDSDKTLREGGHQARIGFSKSSNQFARYLQKNTRFFGPNSLCLAVAEWLSGQG